MTPKTWDYLSSVVSDSFKREVDLDESVWRTLPFFVAAFGLAITLLSYIAAAFDRLHAGWVVALTYLLFGVSLGAFAWAFRWFWSVVSARTYQYPPSDLDLLAYAAGLTKYHKETGLQGNALDGAVAEEMKVFVSGQLAAASGLNRVNNAIKVLARSQAILFLMIGFALAIATEAVIFVDSRAYGTEESSNAKAGEPTAEGVGQEAPPETTRAAGAPVRDRGSPANQGIDIAPPQREEKMTGETPKTPPQAQPQPQPQRPTPPDPQLLKKNEDRPRTTR